jgi:two-component system chemotaxis sensor kinase CheA
MDKKDDEFLKRINATFRIEAEEHLKAFSNGLIDLEKKQSEERYAEILEIMFREIHCLKGASRSVDQKDIEAICQPLESTFSSLKKGELVISAISLDLFHKTAQRLTQLIHGSGSGLTGSDRQSQRELIRQLKEVSGGETQTIQNGAKTDSKEIFTLPMELASSGADFSQNATTRVANPISPQTVRINISKLDPLLMHSEELRQSKKAFHQRFTELTQLNTSIEHYKTESLKWKRNRAENSTKLLTDKNEEFETFLDSIEYELAGITRSLNLDQYNLSNMADIHIETMRQILMLPVSSIVETFPGMVREISREQGKEIEFIVRGTDLEIDKRILEELKDPLIHLIRNSIDHGIGTPIERVSQNKPSGGSIILDFKAEENGIMEITVSDDGIGINRKEVLLAAIKSGKISREEGEKLDPENLLLMIFQSGVSTNSRISEISGRGLGLSITKEKVEKLNGRITVKTEEYKGTSFIMHVPTTLSTFKGIHVKVNESGFIIPTTNVERVLKTDLSEIKTIENNQTILFEDQVLSLKDLGEILGLSKNKPAESKQTDSETGRPKQILIMVLVSGQDRIAFKVDEVMDEQQVLVKSLGKLLKRVRNISGATILGSGKVVPVLHVPDLIKSTFKSASLIKVISTEEKPTDRIKNILVADDSITSRTLIKNILETAGYKVNTAVDGIEAFTKARSNEYDLIVSDADMPRMNGFELIAKIRQDKKISEVPVILVTALGSREDREHGIEAGADAYIVKSSFDQTNLLEIIKKLI